MQSGYNVMYTNEKKMMKNSKLNVNMILYSIICYNFLEILICSV